MVCLFKFSEDGREIYIEYYSLMKESYFKSLNQITLSIPTKECTEHKITRYSLLSAATCGRNATKIGTCDICGHSETVEIEGTRLPHVVESYVITTKATCERNAVERGLCLLCNQKVTRERPNTATGHNFGAGAASPSCINCGKARASASVS